MAVGYGIAAVAPNIYVAIAAVVLAALRQRRARSSATPFSSSAVRRTSFAAGRSR